MKKFFAILLAGVLTVGLAACGGSDDAATNDDSNKEEITLWTDLHGESEKCVPLKS